jgi:hypothetical protein
LDARNHIENRILDVDFGISGAAEHGGKLNGVHSRKPMSEADEIFEAIEEYLLSYCMREDRPPMTTSRRYAVHSASIESP